MKGNEFFKMHFPSVMQKWEDISNFKKFLHFPYGPEELDIKTAYKVGIATMTHDHDDTPHAILTLLVVPGGK